MSDPVNERERAQAEKDERRPATLERNWQLMMVDVVTSNDDGVPTSHRSMHPPTDEEMAALDWVRRGKEGAPAL